MNNTEWLYNLYLERMAADGYYDEDVLSYDEFEDGMDDSGWDDEW